MSADSTSEESADAAGRASSPGPVDTSVARPRRTVGQNVEIPQYTEALYDARELAMGRMQTEAEQLEAEGIVGVQLLSLPHRWGGHTTEFFAIGTAVRPLREDHVIATPTLVLPLVD